MGLFTSDRASGVEKRADKDQEALIPFIREEFRELEKDIAKYHKAIKKDLLTLTKNALKNPGNPKKDELFDIYLRYLNKHLNTTNSQGRVHEFIFVARKKVDNKRSYVEANASPKTTLAAIEDELDSALQQVTGEVYSEEKLIERDIAQAN